MAKNDKVSVIISTRNEEDNIVTCLTSILNQSYKNIEILVIDNNSTDRTKEIARMYTKFVFNKGPERSSQRNFGAKVAHGKYLIFIDADMKLTRDVISECLISTKKNNSSAVVIPEKSYGFGFWAKCKSLEKSFYIGIDWIESSRFFLKESFIQVGGYNKNLISGEDWELQTRINSVSSTSRISKFILHNEGPLSLKETIMKKYYYALHIKKYKKKANNELYGKQASIIKRYQLFLSNPRKLFANPLTGLGLLFMKTCEFGFGAIGYLQGLILTR